MLGKRIDPPLLLSYLLSLHVFHDSVSADQEHFLVVVKVFLVVIFVHTRSLVASRTRADTLIVHFIAAERALTTSDTERVLTWCLTERH